MIFVQYSGNRVAQVSRTQDFPTRVGLEVHKRVPRKSEGGKIGVWCEPQMSNGTAQQCTNFKIKICCGMLSLFFPGLNRNPLYLTIMSLGNTSSHPNFLTPNLFFFGTYKMVRQK